MPLNEKVVQMRCYDLSVVASPVGCDMSPNTLCEQRKDLSAGFTLL